MLLRAGGHLFGRSLEATEDWNRALETDPDPVLTNRMARALVAVGKPQEAHQHLNRFHQKEKLNLEGTHLLASLLRRHAHERLPKILADIKNRSQLSTTLKRHQAIVHLSRNEEEPAATLFHEIVHDEKANPEDQRFARIFQAYLSWTAGEPPVLPTDSEAPQAIEELEVIRLIEGNRSELLPSILSRKSAFAAHPIVTILQAATDRRLGRASGAVNRLNALDPLLLNWPHVQVELARCQSEAGQMIPALKTLNRLHRRIGPTTTSLALWQDLCLRCGLPTPPQTTDPIWKELLLQRSESLTLGRYADIEHAVQETSIQRPQTHLGLALQIESHVMKGAPNRALAHFNRTRDQLNEREAALLLGWLAHMEGHEEKAKACLFPLMDQPDSRTRWILLHLQTGDFEPAAEAIKNSAFSLAQWKAIESEAVIARAQSISVHAARAALDRKPGDPRLTLNWIRRSLGASNSIPDSSYLDASTRALASVEGEREATATHGWLLYRLNRFKDCLSFIEKVPSLASVDPRLNYFQACSESALGKQQAAIRSAQACLANLIPAESWPLPISYDEFQNWMNQLRTRKNV
ncbi:MAG: hypothetical protein AAF514_14805 [Verrucomicrobiota bacterium]